MRISANDYDQITAVHAKGFWYNLVPGTFRFVGEDEISTTEAAPRNLIAYDIYEFEYRRRTFGAADPIRMQVRDDLITAVQCAGRE